MHSYCSYKLFSFINTSIIYRSIGASVDWNIPLVLFKIVTEEHFIFRSIIYQNNCYETSYHTRDVIINYIVYVMHYL